MKKIMLAGAVLCLPAAAFCDDECSCDITPGFTANVSVGLGLGGTPCDIEENYGKTVFIQGHQIVRGQPQFADENSAVDSITTLVNGVDGHSGWNGDNKATLNLLQGLCKTGELEDAEVSADQLTEALTVPGSTPTKLKQTMRKTPLNVNLGLGAAYQCDSGLVVGLQVNGTLDDATTENYNLPGVTSYTTRHTELKKTRFSFSGDLTVGYSVGRYTWFLGAGANWGQTRLNHKLLCSDRGQTVEAISANLKQKKVRPEILGGTKLTLNNTTKLVTTLKYTFPKSKTATWGPNAAGLKDEVNFWVRKTEKDEICTSQTELNTNRDEYEIRAVPVENENIFVSQQNGSVKLKQKGAFSVSVAAEYSFPFSGL